MTDADKRLEEIRAELLHRKHYGEPPTEVDWLLAHVDTLRAEVEQLRVQLAARDADCAEYEKALTAAKESTEGENYLAGISRAAAETLERRLAERDPSAALRADADCAAMREALESARDGFEVVRDELGDHSSDKFIAEITAALDGTAGAALLAERDRLRETCAAMHKRLTVLENVAHAARVLVEARGGVSPSWDDEEAIAHEALEAALAAKPEA